MNSILTIASVGVLNILCFLIGAKVGQKVVNKEEIKLPNINPIKAVEVYKENKEYKEQQEQFNTMLDNINNYDGTSMGQREIS